MENYGVELGEEKALIEYILNNLSEENKSGVTEEVVTSVLDAMLDYYEESGILDETEDSDEEVEINEFELASFVAEKLAKEEILLSQSQLEEILDLEFEYNQKDGVYE